MFRDNCAFNCSWVIALVIALDVRHHGSALGSSALRKHGEQSVFSVKKDEPVVVIKKELTQLYSNGISSCVSSYQDI